MIGCNVLGDDWGTKLIGRAQVYLSERNNSNQVTATIHYYAGLLSNTHWYDFRNAYSMQLTLNISGDGGSTSITMPSVEMKSVSETYPNGSLWSNRGIRTTQTVVINYPHNGTISLSAEAVRTVVDGAPDSDLPGGTFSGESTSLPAITSLIAPNITSFVGTSDTGIRVGNGQYSNSNLAERVWLKFDPVPNAISYEIIINTSYGDPSAAPRKYVTSSHGSVIVEGLNGIGSTLSQLRAHVRAVGPGNIYSPWANTSLYTRRVAKPKTPGIDSTYTENNKKFSITFTPAANIPEEHYAPIIKAVLYFQRQRWGSGSWSTVKTVTKNFSLAVGPSQFTEHYTCDLGYKWRAIIKTIDYFNAESAFAVSQTIVCTEPIKIPIINAIQRTSNVNSIKVIFSQPGDYSSYDLERFAGTIFRIKSSDASTWTILPTYTHSAGNYTIDISDFVFGTTLQISCRYIDRFGQQGSWSPISIIVKNAPAPAPQYNIQTIVKAKQNALNISPFTPIIVPNDQVASYTYSSDDEFSITINLETIPTKNGLPITKVRILSVETHNSSPIIDRTINITAGETPPPQQFNNIPISTLSSNRKTFLSIRVYYLDDAMSGAVTTKTTPEIITSDSFISPTILPPWGEVNPILEYGVVNLPLLQFTSSYVHNQVNKTLNIKFNNNIFYTQSYNEETSFNNIDLRTQSTISTNPLFDALRQADTYVDVTYEIIAQAMTGQILVLSKTVKFDNRKPFNGTISINNISTITNTSQGSIDTLTTYYEHKSALPKLHYSVNDEHQGYAKNNITVYLKVGDDVHIQTINKNNLIDYNGIWAIQFPSLQAGEIKTLYCELWAQNDVINNPMPQKQTFTLQIYKAQNYAGATTFPIERTDTSIKFNVKNLLAPYSQWSKIKLQSAIVINKENGIEYQRIVIHDGTEGSTTYNGVNYTPNAFQWIVDNVADDLIFTSFIEQKLTINIGGQDKELVFIHSERGVPVANKPIVLLSDCLMVNGRIPGETFVGDIVDKMQLECMPIGNTCKFCTIVNSPLAAKLYTSSLLDTYSINDINQFFTASATGHFRFNYDSTKNNFGIFLKKVNNEVVWKNFIMTDYNNNTNTHSLNIPVLNRITWKLKHGDTYIVDESNEVDGQSLLWKFSNRNFETSINKNGFTQTWLNSSFKIALNELKITSGEAYIRLTKANPTSPTSNIKTNSYRWDHTAPENGAVFSINKFLYLYGNNAMPFFLYNEDNTAVLGTGTKRWRAIYAANGVIQTSGRAEKEKIKHIQQNQWVQILNHCADNIVTFKYRGQEDQSAFQLGLIADDMAQFSAFEYLGTQEIDENGVTHYGLQPLSMATLGIWGYGINRDKIIMLEKHIQQLESMIQILVQKDERTRNN